VGSDLGVSSHTLVVGSVNVSTYRESTNLLNILCTLKCGIKT
jgi:hypothetical protein